MSYSRGAHIYRPRLVPARLPERTQICSAQVLHSLPRRWDSGVKDMGQPRFNRGLGEGEIASQEIARWAA